MQQTELERIARLEARADNYDDRWTDNKQDHVTLMATVNRIDRNILVYKYVVWTAALLIGAMAGFVVREWNWLTKTVGH